MENRFPSLKIGETKNEAQIPKNRHQSDALQHNGPGSEAGCIVIISKVVDASSMNPMKRLHSLELSTREEDIDEENS